MEDVSENVLRGSQRENSFLITSHASPCRHSGKGIMKMKRLERLEIETLERAPGFRLFSNIVGLHNLLK
jgi:hypothetical protein